MGDKYAEALSKSFKYLEPTKINLKNNNITDKGAVSVML